MDRAGVLLEVGRYADARAMLIKAMAAAPDDVECHCLLALAHYRLESYAEALTESRQAVALSPDDEWPHRLIASVLLKVGQTSDAVRAAREAVRLAPDLWQTHVMLADALAGSPTANQEAWQVALAGVRLAPDETETHLTAGLVAAEGKHWKHAEHAYRQALAIEPGNAAAMYGLGLVRLREGHSGVALSEFAAAARADPRLQVSRDTIEAVVSFWIRRAQWLSALGVYTLVKVADLALPDGVMRLVLAAVAVYELVLVGLFGWKALRGLDRNLRPYVKGLPRRDRLQGVRLACVVITVLTLTVLPLAPAAAWPSLYPVAVLSLLAGILIAWLRSGWRRWRRRHLRGALRV